MKNIEIDYLNGWFSEEFDSLGSFRWIGKTAVCKIKDLGPGGKKYLSFSAGHSFSEKEIPELKILINGEIAGLRKIASAFSVYCVPFEESGEFIIEFILDRVSNITGDGRDLGVMVRDLDILLPDEMNIYADGWYLPEKSDSEKKGEHRWMKQKATCVLGPIPSGVTTFFVMTCGHPYPNAGNPGLEIKISGEKKEEFEILPGQNRFIVPLENMSGYVDAELSLNKVFDKAEINESRELGMFVTKLELLAGDSVDTYFEGWYPPEEGRLGTTQDSSRWMKQGAVCVFTGLKEKAFRFLVLEAGHPFRNDVDPELSIQVSGEEKAAFKIKPDEKKYLIPLGITQDFIRVDMTLDKTFPAAAPGDERTLGILVKKVEVKTPAEIEMFFEGWNKPEKSSLAILGGEPRWMKKQGVCFFSGLEPDQRRYLLIQGGHPFFDEENPILEVWADKELKGEAKIQGENNTYIFPLGYTKDHVQLDMKVNKIFVPSDKDDKRELGMLVHKIELISKKDDEILVSNNYNGWHEWEQDNFYKFIWISDCSKSSISPRQEEAYKYISFYAFSEFMDFSQKLVLRLDGVDIGEIPLMHKWNFYSVEIKQSTEQIRKIYRKNEGMEGSEFELEFCVNKLFPSEFHLDDNRKLGVRIAEVKLHNDDEAHTNFLYFHRNAVMNYREMIEGKSELDSFPLNLGIDLYGRCNIKPPCVYCLWDSMKELEGEYSEVNVDEKTLEEYGFFFKSARTLVNCSFGEPLLHPRLPEILELCAKHNKYLELSTNGQAFTRRTIQALVGKPIFLYVSLDAATKETYAKIRNDKWDSIIPNLELLNQERKRHNNFPKINMVFMPMKVNIDDLEEYFRLCQRIQADALVLRPLLFLWNPKIEKDRGGYHFNYKDELLPRTELEEIFRQCELFSERYGVPVANQFEFGTIKEPGSKTSTDFYFEFQRS